jgi:hypothetical protein
MKISTSDAIEGLRWVLGVVVLWLSYFTLRGALGAVQAMEGSGHIGVHTWVRLVLASVEILATVMFLAPVVNVAGAYLLLAVFAFAVLFHLLHGQFEVGLLVYAMAVVVWLAHHKEARARQRDAR